ncbi:hypothetical protein IFM89_010757 [Coptis chinensis]|uniref:U1 small nuclear ribonucleoprotein 70 kDa n=1 Tax=Coptis chinensis TaxID=261450 RepID=A0A835M8B2_9MAGN|nr:hypothetical protein IFM89_010757 [Coptis chinensis]
MAQYVSNFAEPGTAEYAPPAKKAETAVQRRARVHQLRLESGAKKAAEELEKYDPSNDPNISGDPYKTLFVARLSYETTESKIKREFEQYGPIKKVGSRYFRASQKALGLLPFDLFVGSIRLGKALNSSEQISNVHMVTDKSTNKPRGYAFIEFMHTQDMKSAYKQGDGRKLNDRRILVDVERGRTVPNWRPRRLGGGLGSTRIGGEEVNMKEIQQLTSGGPSRSEEPRSREERHVDRDREKSHERGRERDREREKSRERSHDRTRDRELRDERLHRGRERTRDRDRDKDGRREHDRDRGRDSDRRKDKDCGCEHPQDRDRDTDCDRGRSRDKDTDYDRIESKHGRDRRGERDRDHDNMEPDHGHGYNLPEPEHDLCEPRGEGQYSHLEPQTDHERYDHVSECKYDRYDEEAEEYRYDCDISEPREREKIRDQGWDYRHSERSVSREIEH